ncbi:hypothetical protein EV07_0375 [Prochlorococcus sp. MIT 0603]|nr:hypothetical protein EV07_0375 [Prochlorococcus sp. MIT 0603]
MATIRRSGKGWQALIRKKQMFTYLQVMNTLFSLIPRS